MGLALWLKRRPRDRKVAGSSPRAGAAGELFFSRVNFAESYFVSVPTPCYIYIINTRA